MSTLDNSLDAFDRLIGNYSKEEILAVLAKVRENRVFEGPTIEEYFNITEGLAFSVYQDDFLPHQPISPPCYPSGANQKIGLGFSEVFFFM